MKIKDFLGLCSDEFCDVKVHDLSRFGEDYFSHPKDAIEAYGNYSVTSWSIEKFAHSNVMSIKTKTCF